MCCLTIYKTQDDKLVITHNRDEQISRQLSSHEIITEIINGRKVWMPKDGLSNGTWIATDGQLTGLMLNGFKENHIKKTTYKASRGTIIPILFQKQGVERFIDEFDPTDYEPFTLVISEKDKELIEYGWDEHKVYVTALDDNAAYINSSSTLYDDVVKHNREILFFDWLKSDCSEFDIWNLHSQKGNDHSRFLNVEYNENICTVAISQIVLGKDNVFHYESLVENNSRKTLKLT